MMRAVYSSFTFTSCGADSIPQAVETRRSTIYVRTSVSVSDSFSFQLLESVEHAAAVTSE